MMLLVVAAAGGCDRTSGAGSESKTAARREAPATAPVESKSSESAYKARSDPEVTAPAHEAHESKEAESPAKTDQPAQTDEVAKTNETTPAPSAEDQRPVEGAAGSPTPAEDEDVGLYGDGYPPEFANLNEAQTEALLRDPRVPNATRGPSGWTIEVTPLAGPFASIEALCKDAKKTAPDPYETCGPKPLPTWLEAKIEVPPSIEAAALLEIVDPARSVLMDASCVLALRTSKGWFHFTWPCEDSEEDDDELVRHTSFHSTESLDRIRKGAPELVAWVGQGGGGEERDIGQEQRIICDASSPAAPWCVGPFAVEQRIRLRDDDETVVESWTRTIVPTPQGFRLERGKGTLPKDVSETLGEYVVKIEPRGG